MDKTKLRVAILVRGNGGNADKQCTSKRPYRRGKDPGLKEALKGRSENHEVAREVELCERHFSESTGQLHQLVCEIIFEC